MAKKSSKVIPSQMREETAGEEEKPSSAPKKPASEIDEIFAGKKRKKSEPETGKPDEEVTKRLEKPKKKKNIKKKTKGSDDGELEGLPSRPRKKTEDGLAIYTEEELGINKADGGGTSFCPFDCSCCF